MGQSLKGILKTVFNMVIFLILGEGTLSFQDGTIIKGEWENGILKEETK